MADVNKLMPFLLSWEGGFVNDPDDAGGATNKGVTLKTFREFYGQDMEIEDLKNITDFQWNEIFKSGYWDACRADEIIDQSVANLLVDWAYNSGARTAVKYLQGILGISRDGIIGSISLSHINSSNGETLFNSLKNARVEFLHSIVENRPQNEKFLKGWLRRVDSIRYDNLILNM